MVIILQLIPVYGSAECRCHGHGKNEQRRHHVGIAACIIASFSFSQHDYSPLAVGQSDPVQMVQGIILSVAKIIILQEEFFSSEEGRIHKIFGKWVGESEIVFFSN